MSTNEDRWGKILEAIEALKAVEAVETVNESLTEDDQTNKEAVSKEEEHNFMEKNKIEKIENQSEYQVGQLIPDFTWNDDQDLDGSGTKRLTAFPIDKKHLRTECFIHTLQKYIQELQELFNRKDRGLQIEEHPVRIYPQHQLLMQDYKRTALTIHDIYLSYGNLRGMRNAEATHNFIKQVPDIGITWRLCTKSDAECLFQNFQTADWGSMNKENNIYGVTLHSANTSPYMFFLTGSHSTFKFNQDDSSWSGKYAADIHIAYLPEDQNALKFLLAHNWTPTEAKDDPMWKKLVEAFHRKWISIESTPVTDASKIQIPNNINMITIQPTEYMLKAVGQGELDHWGLSYSNIQFSVSVPQLLDDAKSELLRRDTVRADILASDPKSLEDPNGGSWELWNPDLQEYDMVSIPTPVYARDPRKDIVKGGLIGIDFGTKSTVVVCMESSDHIQPVRVGMGQFSRDPRESDYENPTVMEFIDLDRFLNNYTARRGRPLTRWEDLTISHTAFEQWKNNDQTNYYSAYFGELKQWAGNAEHWVRIRDKAGKEISLRPYAQLRDEDFDPIEVYAYYIGLYINNMQTRKIYLEYLLSFPVTYSIEIRQRILQSFRKGLAKSLPEAVRNDPECFSGLSVTEGAGEPAAYALCALQEYGFNPQGDEKVYFGIFDFGGGTTDFDFGVLERAPRTKRPMRHKFIIKHFGDGGDQYLGGENLLELMAFHVFRENQSDLRNVGADSTDSKVSVPFTKPYQEELFVGHENLISDSQEARTNTRRMMEELRPLWEHTDDYEQKYASGALKVRLFTSNGGETTVELKLDKQVLEELLHKRIRRGIDEFFSALYTVFHKEDFMDNKLKQVHIFLAGNASKSVILREEFNKAIHNMTQDIYSEYCKRWEDPQTEQEYFVLFPPLGTQEALDLMRERGCEYSESGLERPTGKTGVAFGLILSRKGSIYKVESEKRQDEEIKFQFYIGTEDVEKDGYFEALLNPDSPYGQWIEYYDAGERSFEFHYTTAPSANRRGVLPISETKISRNTIPDCVINEDWSIFLRPVSPNEIEYVVAKSEEDAQSEQYQYGPEQIKLEK